MFMNDIKNDYFYPMGGTSVVLEVSKEKADHDRHNSAVVHPDMTRFIDAMRTKRPTWRFKSTEYVHGIEGFRLMNFDVYDGNEELGRVWIDNHRRSGDTRYCLNNHRLEAARQRGGGSFSTKVAVATKKVLDSFSVKSLAELAVSANKSMYEVVYNAAATRVNNAALARRRAAEALSDYIVDNWEQLRGYAGDAGKADLPELRQLDKEASAIRHAYSNNGGTKVAMHGEQLLMWRDKADAKLVGWAALTDKQRANLGILKLVDNKTLIDGIGMRTDTDTFFLLD
jgi:hypothetical protein